MEKTQLIDTIASRENLIRVLDNLKEGIIAHDMDRRIFFFNTEAERITGYKRHEVIGRDCHEVFDSPFCGEHCSFRQDRTIMADHFAYPLNIIAKDGTPRRIEMSITMMQDENGQYVGVLAVINDQTEIFKLKQRTCELTRFANIIGRNAKMQTVFQLISDVAGYDFPVHITGETGTGKELVANAIHNESRRAGAPFVPINCGALPEGLIESELFGHVKGAFSGAIRDKKGRFELADGGTLFLDEVAELAKPLQVKLLRFLQEGKFEKVGGEKTISVNVRVISATNKDLKKQIRKGRFREDLFYRLNVIPIHIPPVRERRSDIPLLIEYFLEKFCRENGHEAPRISQDAMALMMDYRWPGNVRQIQNAVQFAIVRSNGRVIGPQHLPLELRQAGSPAPRRGPSRKLTPEMVAAALKQTAGNKARAAKNLGVGRATLYRFLADHPELTAANRT